jgi:Protein of unknown function (DUF433)
MRARFARGWQMIMSQIGAGHSIDEVLTDYPYLECKDILQALRYAAWRAEERESSSRARESADGYELVSSMGQVLKRCQLICFKKTNSAE